MRWASQTEGFVTYNWVPSGLEAATHPEQDPVQIRLVPMSILCVCVQEE